MPTVISVENLSKSYRLGQIGTGTLTNDLKVWLARLQGKPNPLLKIGQADHGNRAGETLWALKDVSFTVQQGEVLGIIGRNGAGKSTLLKILSRVTAPTSGCVKVKGRIASLLEVGTGFHPELTGRENIYLNGAILGMTKEEVRRKFDEIVAFAEVEQFIDTPVKRYSSGMYVRLAFAVAAHLEPEILLVDEVLAVGDAAFQKKCIGKMSQVAMAGRTVLFVSHDLTNIIILCNKTLLIHHGKLIKIDYTKNVIENYYEISKNTITPNLHVNLGGPSTRNVQITSLYMQSQINRISKEEFTISEKIAIVINYCVSNVKKPSRLNPVVVVKTVLGLTLFSSANYEDPHLGRKIYDQDGNYSAICIIPEYLLNNGSYVVDVMIVSDMRDVVEKITDAAEFTVIDDGSSRGDYVGSWDGIIRPRCIWEGTVV